MVYRLYLRFLLELTSVQKSEIVHSSIVRKNLGAALHGAIQWKEQATQAVRGTIWACCHGRKNNEMTVLPSLGQPRLGALSHCAP